MKEHREIFRAVPFVGQVVPQTPVDSFKACVDLMLHRMFSKHDWKSHTNGINLELRFDPVDVNIICFPSAANVSTTRLRAVLEKLSIA